VMMERVTEKALEGFKLDGAEVAEERDNWDYVHARADLAELPGRKFHAKRNLVERCLAAHHCVYEPITPALLPEVAEMQQRWCEERACDEAPGLCDEYLAIKELLANYERLGMTGGAMRVDGKVEAYCVGEGLSPGTAVVHVEKAMQHVEGLYQVVNQMFCRNALTDFQYVNREQDMGIAGIRKAKQSYLPRHMVKKYVVRLRAAGQVV